ncbi:MAG: hypothetical protein ACR2PI_18200 [Hyphomicrobiaceae bacterium]
MVQTLGARHFKLVLAERGAYYDANKFFRPSLLGYMIATPPDRMFYVDSVDKVGRWNIDLAPHKFSRPTSDQDFIHGCFNTESWLADKSAAAEFNKYSGAGYKPDLNRSKNTLSVSIDEFFGRGCSYTANGGEEEQVRTRLNVSSVITVGNRHYRIKQWQFLPADTPLTDLIQ